MHIRLLVLTGALLALSAPAFAQQPAAETKQEDPAAKEKAEAAKRLAEVDKAADAAKRKELLEKYIQDYPKASNIDSAYMRLLAVLYDLDLARVIALADEILARPRDPKSTLWKGAYAWKFRALHKQISALGSKILETETDPGVLQTAAGLDRENSTKLYEKAIAERKKSDNKETYPTLEDLHFSYANKLSEIRRKDEAVKEAARSVELSLSRIAEVEALPKEDAKRRNLQRMQEGLGFTYRELALLYFEYGEPQKGLDALAKAEERLGSGARAREMRPSIETLRGKIYAGMGKPDEALESYTRAFAYQMGPMIRNRIRELASTTGKPADTYFARARELRIASAEPLKPFQLKTDDGKPVTPESLKAKVTLVNFFFPT